MYLSNRFVNGVQVTDKEFRKAEIDNKVVSEVVSQVKKRTQEINQDNNKNMTL